MSYKTCQKKHNFVDRIVVHNNITLLPRRSESLARRHFFRQLFITSNNITLSRRDKYPYIDRGYDGDGKQRQMGK